MALAGIANEWNQISKFEKLEGEMKITSIGNITYNKI